MTTYPISSPSDRWLTLPGHAFVMGWFEEQVGRLDRNGALSFGSDLCARSKVRDVVE